jgi:hypothetical protein
VAARASAAGAALSACGPIARIPPSPTRPPGEEVVARTPSLPTAVEAERLARTLAPVLYRQADERSRSSASSRCCTRAAA